MTIHIKLRNTAIFNAESYRTFNKHTEGNFQPEISLRGLLHRNLTNIFR
jgi:hypothetical protein